MAKIESILFDNLPYKYQNTHYIISARVIQTEFDMSCCHITLKKNLNFLEKYEEEVLLEKLLLDDRLFTIFDDIQDLAKTLKEKVVSNQLHINEFTNYCELIFF